MTAALSLLAAASVAQTPSIDRYVQPAFKDATFTARVKSANQRELAKINDDFGAAYRFEFTRVQIKDPYMVRLETTVEDTNILFIINGPIRRVRVPRANVNLRTDLSKKPGQRQTFLDFGLLTPSMFRGDLWEAKFVRMDRQTGDAVFDLSYIDRLGDTSRHRVWIDPDRKFVTKREWFGQRGNQLATFTYTNPRQVNGVWLPTLATVRNNTGKVAGETEYTEIRVNTGIADSVFSVR